MAGEYTPEMIAMLEAQRAYFASDECLVERADEFRDLSPAECWRATKELCASLDWFLRRMDPETRERALAPEPVPEDTLAALVAWKPGR